MSDHIVLMHPDCLFVAIKDIRADISESWTLRTKELLTFKTPTTIENTGKIYSEWGSEWGESDFNILTIKNDKSGRHEKVVLRETDTWVKN